MFQFENEIIFKGMPRTRYKNIDVLFDDAKKDTRYWWWAFLRISPDYWFTCSKSGKVGDKRLRSMYCDFGNVFSTNFEDWWKSYGVNLFAEEISLPAVRVIDKKQPQFSKGNIKYLILEIPLNLTEATIKNQVLKCVKSAYGREILRITSAPRPLAKLKGIRKDVLQIAHQVSQLDYKSRKGKNLLENGIGQIKGSKSLYQIGKELRLVKSCMPTTGETAARSRRKINGMKVAVSRMLNRAKYLAQNAAVGVFPCSHPLKEPLVWSESKSKAIEDAILNRRFRPLYCDNETLDFF
jgi:hypothetical protein